MELLKGVLDAGWIRMDLFTAIVTDDLQILLLCLLAWLSTSANHRNSCEMSFCQLAMLHRVLCLPDIDILYKNKEISKINKLHTRCSLFFYFHTYGVLWFSDLFRLLEK
ncbi:hypothetical protein PPACK8108_LOCUS3083 [Phakopsora pachyrhizi]|uniref:Uncharacterized protein n=1 Tax=Phakopsora pachyrhizi TaxID=170000 RepID=A0AAV0AKU9_PHAPC|nr:hypothetical protein PPACK8108_LOCUS3083 [Phakopsora pachyrhizi]